MPSQHDDPARSGVAEDPDPAMLVGALGDERTGLDQEPYGQQPDEGVEGAADAGGPAALQRARRSGRDSGNLLGPEVMQDADPAMLVGALGDERTGLEVERDSATDQDDVANQVEEPHRPGNEPGR
jgi:hypothetical protein